MYTPTISRIAGLVIIDTLATSVALRRDAAHDSKLARMKRQLTAMRSGQRFELPTDLPNIGATPPQAKTSENEQS
jgi:hypothetical protein